MNIYFNVGLIRTFDYRRDDHECPERTEQIEIWLDSWLEATKKRQPIAAALPNNWPTLPAGLLSNPGNVLDHLLARYDAQKDGRSPRGVYAPPARFVDAVLHDERHAARRQRASRRSSRFSRGGRSAVDRGRARRGAGGAHRRALGGVGERAARVAAARVVEVAWGRFRAVSSLRSAGVTSASVALSTEKGKVSYDPNTLGTRDVVEAINNLGFTASIASKSEKKICTEN